MADGRHIANLFCDKSAADCFSENLRRGSNFYRAVLCIALIALIMLLQDVCQSVCHTPVLRRNG